MSDCETPSPLIGLTTYLQQAQTGVWDLPAVFLQKDYLDAVTAAGGIATLLPPQPVDPEIAARVLDGLEGLIITGGRDINPVRYGHQPHPSTEAPAHDRDDWEFALLDGALRRGMPVLGICRGAQLLNVALGGTLHQSLPDTLGHNRHQQGNGVFGTSVLGIVAGSRLADLVSDGTEVQCYHRQAIDRLGNGLVVSARDADGVIEAVEMLGDEFVVAVQWHPEVGPESSRVFSGLVGAASKYAKERTSL